MIEQNGVFAQITGIEWERIWLELEVKVTGHKAKSLGFYLVNEQYNATAELKQVDESNGIYRLRLNITNDGENRCILQGVYKLAVCAGEELLAYAGIADKLVDLADEKSRNFLYNNRNKTCTITFIVEEDKETEQKVLVMRVLLSSKTNTKFPTFGGFWKIFGNVPKQLFGYFKSGKRVIYKYYKLCCMFAPKPSKGKQTVLFMSEQSDTLGGNLQAVLAQMKKRGLDEEYNLLTSARRASSERQKRSTWLGLAAAIAKSDIIFLDDHAPIFDWLEVRKETKIIQLWHAGAGFKSSGYSRWGHEGCPTPTSCHRQYAYGIAGSKNIAHFFSEVWGINDEQVLPTGMPRMDEFLDEGHRVKLTKEIYERYPICKNKKVIMFAPTYRGRDRLTAYYPYEKIDFKELYRVCGDEYVVLFKMHPWVAQEVPIDEKYKDKFVDVGTYLNINDLFYITDLLITDYSSSIFEFSIMRKPMLFFAYDKIEYSFSRGFHRPYEESAPGKVCYEFSELIRAIEEKDFEYEKVEDYVEHHFDYIDTKASDRVIEWFVLGDMPVEFSKAIEAVDKKNAFKNQLNFAVEEVGQQQIRQK